MNRENLRITPPYPGTPLKYGSTGSDVKLMQYYLDIIGEYLYTSLPFLEVDGIFGYNTQSTVIKYQTVKGLKADGIIGPTTWNAIVNDYAGIPDSTTGVYPGSPLYEGDSGPAVLEMQTKLNVIVPTYTAINLQSVDGVFGPNMADATRRFQLQFGLAADEVIGENTWYGIVNVHSDVTSGTPTVVVTAYPGQTLQVGSSGDSVRFVQSYMDRVGKVTGAAFPTVKIDGQFGSATRQLVLAYQKKFGLTQDGIVGANTWASMVKEFNSIL